MTETTDIAVIGAGPGGYAAAFLASDHGFSVTLIDPEANPGGVCLHRGCIPSKALLHAARLLDEAREGARMGLRFGEPEIDLDRLRNWKGEVVQRLTRGLGGQCQRRGVTFIQGRARFLDSGRLEVDPVQGAARIVAFKQAILATGSRPSAIPGLETSLPGVMDSTAALDLETIPASLLVVGGGNIGLELGSVYAALGSRVSVVEVTPGLLPGADRDLVRPLAKRLAERLAAIHLETRVVAMEAAREGGVRVTLADARGIQRQETHEKILVATGRLANTEQLGLERTGVRVERGRVLVHGGQATDDPAIHAIGDVTGGPMLAHKAAYEARIAVATLAGEQPPPADPVIPAVTYTDPELAWAGLTETAARREGIAVRAVRFPWGASGRAHTLERSEGITKLVLEPDTGRILGMGVVGVGAGELIAAGVQAITARMTARELSRIIHPHPTLSETVMESAEVFLGHCVHFHAPKRAR